MKAKMLTYLIFTVIIFLGSSMYIFPQGSNYRISRDTLIAGDTMILRLDTWNYDPGRLKAALIPERTYFPENYPFYYNDTITSYSTEVYSDTTYDFYFAVPIGTIPGLYNLEFLFNENIVEWGLEVNIYTPPFIYRQPGDTILCGKGDTAIFSTMALGNDEGDLIYKWYHNGISYPYYYKGAVVIGDPQLQDTGRYYCVISNSFGKDTSYAARLDLFPVPAKQGPPIGLESFCPGTDSSVYSIHSDPLATGYHWNLLPKTAGIIEQHDTSVVIKWNKDFSGTVRLFADLINEKCEAISTEEIEITVPGISAPPVICIVGIDSESGKYQIVWEKSEVVSPQLFRIYRESNMADVYVEIGSVYPDELSVFIDMSSAPNILSHRYKISYIDSCDNESELSDYHQTLH
jgi:PKD-like domain